MLNRALSRTDISKYRLRKCFLGMTVLRSAELDEQSRVNSGESGYSSSILDQLRKIQDSSGATPTELVCLKRREEAL